MLELKMDEKFLIANHLVPDNEVWVSPKTFENPFSRNISEALKTAYNKQGNTITCSMCKHTVCGLRAAGLEYNVGCRFAERK